MKATHEAEPWSVLETPEANRVQIFSGDMVLMSLTMHHEPSPETSVATLRRAVRCVNGCAGLNPEAVPDLLVVVETLIEGSHDSDAIAHILPTARAAVAKAAP